MKLIIVFFFLCLMAMLLSGCNTLKPRVRIPEVKGADSLIVMPVITNTRTNTIVKPAAEVIRDTVIVEKEKLVIETVTVTDTAMIAAYLDTAFSSLYAMLERQRHELLLVMGETRAAKYQQVELIKKLDTTKKEKEKALQSVATTKKIMFDGTSYLVLLVVLIILGLFLRQQYLQSQLKKKTRAKLQTPKS